MQFFFPQVQPNCIALDWWGIAYYFTVIMSNLTVASNCRIYLYIVAHHIALYASKEEAPI